MALKSEDLTLVSEAQHYLASAYLPTSSPTFSASLLNFGSTGLLFVLNLLNLFFSQFYFLLFPLPGIFPLQLFTSQVHIFFSVGSVLSALASDSLLFWFLSGWFSLFHFLLFLII